MALGDIIGQGVDLFGGNKAANIERRATRKAGKFLDEGYGGALDLARPMQEQSQGDYLDLSRRYGEGDFRNPDQQKYQGGSFDFDPSDVFRDPEYQASQRAGNQAIESGAAGKGMLFSGNTGRALQQSGQDNFAKRSDELYNRGRQAFESDRGFDYDAANRAYDTNAENNALEFSQGNALAGYASPALDRSIDLGLGRAQAKADTELGVGGIRSDAWRSGGKKLGRMGQGVVDGGIDLAKKYISGGAY